MLKFLLIKDPYHHEANDPLDVARIAIALEWLSNTFKYNLRCIISRYIAFIYRSSFFGNSTVHDRGRGG